MSYLEFVINFFVFMVFIWNFLGCLGVGVFLEFVLYEKGLLRLFFIMGVFIVFVFGYIILVFVFFGVFYFGSVLIGFSYGVYWFFIFIVILEFFGLCYFGMLLNVVMMVNFLGSYVFLVCVVGFFYDVEVYK